MAESAHDAAEHGGIGDVARFRKFRPVNRA